MWPNARISVMGGEQAAGVMATVRREGMERKGQEWSAEEEAEFKQPIIDTYEHQGHPYYASARLWDDGVIDPAQRSEEHTSELQSRPHLVCRLLLEKKKQTKTNTKTPKKTQQ